mgnify:CR=1 FL=1
MPIPTLETDRLILRPVSLDDIPSLQRQFNDWEVIKFTRAPWPLPADAVERNLRDLVLPGMLAGTHVSWAIVPKGETEAIGRIDYRLADAPPGRGFWIATAFHGRGYMTEALTVTQDYIFFERNVDRIVVESDAENIGSRRVKEKNGATFLYQQNDQPNHLGHPEDVWEITRENWARIRGVKI